MNIAITGASGFVGRALCSELARQGHAILPVSLRSEASKIHFAGADQVVHLAGIAHRRRVDNRLLRRINVDLARDVGRAAAEAGAPMLFMSTVKVHGEASADEPFSESSAVRPADDYAASKARAEEALAAVPGLKLTVLRPPLVYGPGVKANFLALMKAVAHGLPLPLGSVQNRRTLVYVGNLIDAIVRCLGGAGTFLVSDGRSLSTPELCRLIGRALDRRARLYRFPPRLLPRKLAGSLEVDDALFRRTFSWQAPFSPDQGIIVTANWLLAR